MKPRKHADLIKAWADGAEIEVLTSDNTWVQVRTPSFFEGSKYRIKVDKWEPKGGEWFINACGSVYTDESTEYGRSFGVEFETPESAEKAAKAYRRYHRLYKLAEELNEGWEPDWSDGLQGKWLIRVSSDQSESGLFINHVCHENISGVYFRNYEVAKKAIEIINDGGLD